jgi:hypothetical protein
MAVESTSGIWSLDATLPLSTDDISEGDDHIRAIKSTLSRTFPNISATVAATNQEIDYLSGVTSAVQGQINTISASLQAVIVTVDALSNQAAIAYGGLTIAAASEHTASTSLAAYTNWDAGMPTTNVTVSTANGSLSPDLTGVYSVSVQLSFSGQASTQFDGVLFQDDIETDFGFTRVLGASGDIGSASFVGIVSANASSVLKVRLLSDGADASFVASRGQFQIRRESS